MIRSIVQDKVKPARLIFRPEVLDQVIESAEKYGFGSPFCTKKYLEKRIFDLVIEKKIEYYRGIFKKLR